MQKFLRPLAVGMCLMFRWLRRIPERGCGLTPQGGYSQLHYVNLQAAPSPRRSMENYPGAKPLSESHSPRQRRRHRNNRVDHVCRRHTRRYVGKQEEPRNEAHFETSNTREDGLRTSAIRHQTDPAIGRDVFKPGSLSFESSPKEARQEHSPHSGEQGPTLCEDARIHKRRQVTAANTSRAKSTFSPRCPKGEEHSAKRHAEKRLLSPQIVIANQYGGPMNTDLVLFKPSGGENRATAATAAKAPTPSAGTVGVVSKKPTGGTPSMAQSIQGDGTLTPRQRSLEGCSTDDAPDSLEMHLRDGKLEKLRQDYVYYDTKSGPWSATADTAELCLPESTGVSGYPTRGTAFAIENLEIPRKTTGRSENSAGATTEQRHNLVTCVRANVDEATSQKLTEVKERLHCEDLDCVFNKICEHSHETRQAQSNAFLSDNVKAQVRAALTTCQSNH
ncbi:uncharacterized protein [Dermacentor albipictus]|uniref:uncharacterized protein isoform X4 n=1 Tax=Dermacentor albipictus TaxID=60249 RepID=UPI0038FBEE8D